MRRFSKILGVAAALALALTAVPANAAFEDEQWPQPNDAQDGSHSVLVQDALGGDLTVSMLIAQRGEEQILCSSDDDANCKGVGNYGFVELLPACVTEADLDCIETLTAVDSAGASSSGKFNEYAYSKHPNMFTGNGVQTIKNPASPSVWTLDKAPHAFGAQYALAVSLRGGYGQGNTQTPELNMNLYAVTYSQGIGEADDSNGIPNFFKCNQAKDKDTGKFSLRCGMGAEEFGQYKCALKVQKNGACLMQHAFPEGYRFGVALRLSNEPTGWFHGRMKDPNISVAKLTGTSVKVSVEAAPTKVPVLYQEAKYSAMSAELKAYWDACLKNRTCPSGTRNPRVDPNTEPDGNIRNVIHDPKSYGETAINAVNFFGQYAKDTAAAVPGLWSMRTLSNGEMGGANQCFKTGAGVKGIVTTNATAYSEGPPEFVNGMLNYKVAGLHYAADGQTLNEGVYNMIIKSTVARCIYGFSNAPISASIAVTSASGEAKVATTTVSEKDGWMKLAAYGFTYSSPTISVKLTQAGSAPAKKTTITCVSTKNKKLTKKVTAVGPKCPAGYKKK
ncbi:MAG: hypothetical protein KA421_05220 [Rhodoluna sp.]|nr:hypothetical protein [Rhodoluna sp.]